MSNIAIVIVRYFGGTLLGVPGLINAYKTAAVDAINQAMIIERTVNDVYAIHFSYPVINDVMQVIKELNIKIISQRFENVCFIEASVRQSMTNKFVSSLLKIEGVKCVYQNTL